jgi:hypothetical protein
MVSCGFGGSLHPEGLVRSGPHPCPWPIYRSILGMGLGWGGVWPIYRSAGSMRSTHTWPLRVPAFDRWCQAARATSGTRNPDRSIGGGLRIRPAAPIYRSILHTGLGWRAVWPIYRSAGSMRSTRAWGLRVPAFDRWCSAAPGRGLARNLDRRIGNGKSEVAPPRGEGAKKQRGSRVCSDTAPAPEEETRGRPWLAIRERLVQMRVLADTRLDLARGYAGPIRSTMEPPYQSPRTLGEALSPRGS